VPWFVNAILVAHEKAAMTLYRPASLGLLDR